MRTKLNRGLDGVDRLKNKNPEMYEILKKINKYLPYKAKANVAREFIKHVKETEGRDISETYARNRVSYTLNPSTETHVPFIFDRLLEIASKQKKVIDKSKKLMS
jgi:ribosome biogenesis GTPase A